MLIEFLKTQYNKEEKTLEVICKTKNITYFGGDVNLEPQFFITKKSPETITTSTFNAGYLDLISNGINILDDYHYAEATVVDGDGNSTTHMIFNLEKVTNDIDSDLQFFGIYIRTSVVYPENVPCGLDKVLFYTPIINECVLLSNVICRAQDIIDNCDLSMDFIYKYLLYKLFGFYIQTKQWDQAIQAYNKLVKGKTNINSKSCGCSGQ